MALLNMLYHSLFGNQSQRKMFFKVHILYIDETCAVYGDDEAKRQANIDFIKGICEQYKFTYTIVPLEKVHDIDINQVPALDMKMCDEAMA